MWQKGDWDRGCIRSHEKASDNQRVVKSGGCSLWLVLFKFLEANIAGI